MELIAYHYGEAVQLSQRSTSPLPLPFDPARAVSLLVRAAQLAARSGALAEARNHVWTAINIAPREAHVLLYERLGDIGILGSDAASYLEAINGWRELSERDPVVGARVLRKLSVSCHRWTGRSSVPLSDAEFAALLPEARQLAEQAGDVDTLWRIRMAESFEWWSRARRQSVPDPAEAERRQEIALQAAAYFEEKGDWEACSEALDAAAGPSIVLGRWREVIQLAERRLALPQLPPVERGDARYMLLWALYTLGDYERSLGIVRDLLAGRGVEDSITHLSQTFGWFAVSAVLIGHWSALDEIKPLVAEAFDATGSTARWLDDVYLVLLMVAQAREDRAGMDVAAAALGRLLDGRSPTMKSIVTAYLRNDPAAIDLERVAQRRSEGPTHLTLLLCNEAGFVLPDVFLDSVRRWRSSPDMFDALPPCGDIAEAIAARDPEALAQAIEEAERHHLIPHAARVRIVLAEMTGDPAPLVQARPVLERLGDRQFLRRLEEVAGALEASATQVDT